MTTRPSGRARAPEDADALAGSLRQATASDEALARMEMRLTRALRDRRTAPKPVARLVWLGASLAVAALASFWLTRAEPAPQVAFVPRAAPIVEPAPRVALLHTGESVEGEGQLGNAHLVLVAGAHARVEDDALAHAVVALADGAVRVAFHPEHRGLEHLAIRTDVARVEVVGTEFVVARRADGTTHVAVSEGVVRVVTLATGEAHDVARGEELEVLPPAPIAEAATPTRRVDAPPTLDQAIARADRGDLTALERIADRGDRAARLQALGELSDRHDLTDPDAAMIDYARILALDPTGADGATALFARARLRERLHDGAAATDYARYVDEFPHGSLAHQASQRLCTLDPSRCSEP